MFMQLCSYCHCSGAVVRTRVTSPPQINCKLYAFHKENCSWLERGRGLLRLNDRREEGAGPLHSRLLFRTQGSLRLVLNTKVRAQ